MEDLEGMTVGQLVGLHNEHSTRLIKGWKRKKSELVAIVATLLDTAASDDAKATAAETVVECDGSMRKRHKHDVKGFVFGLITDVAEEMALTAAEVAERVRERFPDAQTSARTVHTYATYARREGRTVVMTTERARRRLAAGGAS